MTAAVAVAAALSGSAAVALAVRSATATALCAVRHRAAQSCDHMGTVQQLYHCVAKLQAEHALSIKLFTMSDLSHWPFYGP